MQKPHSWIIRLECNGQIATLWQKRNVPSWGVVEVEGLDAGVNVVRGCALSEDNKVVAMKMNRMEGLSRGNLVRITQVLSGNNKVDKPLPEILWDDGVKWIESAVVKVQNCGV